MYPVILGINYQTTYGETNDRVLLKFYGILRDPWSKLSDKETGYDIVKVAVRKELN